jgi:hypothetical protein
VQISISLTSQYIFIIDDSLLPALSTIPDQDTVEEQPGYMNALQPDFQGLVGSNSVSRVTRAALRGPEKGPVSNAVPDEAKLQ